MFEYDSKTIARLLKGTDIFSEVPLEVLTESIGDTRLMHLQSGETIIRKGDVGECMYVILDGEVKVHDGEITVAYLGSGKYFGEMSLLQTMPRSMSITATTPMEVVEISQESFYKMLSREPRLIRKLIGELVSRLSRQNESRVLELRTKEDDLRHQVEIQTALYKEAKEKAERSEKFKQQFLANMSHEIRTPMNAVVGMTNLVLDLPLEPKQRSYLEGIKRSSGILLRIINDILDLAKIEEGKMELEKIDISLSEIATMVMETLRHRANEKGLDLHLNIDPSITDVVLGDPVRLNQVLANLVGNAIKFTESGSVTVKLDRGSAGTEVIFSVRDTGVGIPEDKLQSIFESFTQANSSDTRKFGGTGLGLSISKQLVALMGGDISVSSVEGEGSTFSFTAHFEPGSSERLHAVERTSIDGAVLDGLRILVVDDNEYNRIVAKDTLESKSKAVVVVAEGGMEAIELLRKQPFDVVLMDVQMPVMNGYETTKYIRSEMEAPTRDIPIVALTASVLRTDLEKCTEVGMDSFIPKPFTAAQLIKGIAEVMNIKVSESTSEEAASTTAQGPSTVANLTYLREFCNGDDRRMRKYIGIFLASAEPLMQHLEAALSEKDWIEMANQVHGFKTSAMMMGLEECRALAVDIEIACREGGDEAEIVANATKLMTQVRTAVDELALY